MISSTIQSTSVASTMCTSRSARHGAVEQMAADLDEAVEVVHVAGQERHLDEWCAVEALVERGDRLALAFGDRAQLGQVRPQGGDLRISLRGRPLGRLGCRPRSEPRMRPVDDRRRDPDPARPELLGEPHRLGDGVVPAARPPARNESAVRSGDSSPTTPDRGTRPPSRRRPGRRPPRRRARRTRRPARSPAGSAGRRCSTRAGRRASAASTA